MALLLVGQSAPGFEIKRGLPGQQGQHVQVGEPLAVVHAANAAAAEQAQRTLQALIQIGEVPITPAPVMVQRVTA